MRAWSQRMYCSRMFSNVLEGFGGGAADLPQRRNDLRDPVEARRDPRPRRGEQVDGALVAVSPPPLGLTDGVIQVGFWFHFLCCAGRQPCRLYLLLLLEPGHTQQSIQQRVGVEINDLNMRLLLCLALYPKSQVLCRLT